MQLFSISNTRSAGVSSCTQHSYHRTPVELTGELLVFFSERTQYVPRDTYLTLPVSDSGSGHLRFQ
jgi:hypothetical protein